MHGLQFGGGKGQITEHVCPEPGPLCHPLDGGFFPSEDVRDLLQLLLIPLQVSHALSLKHVQFLLPVFIHRNIFGQVGVEAEISVRRKEGVKHSMNLLSVSSTADDICKFGFETCIGGVVLARVFEAPCAKRDHTLQGGIGP